MTYFIDDERKWRISKSGYSIKSGWAGDKRIIASYPGAHLPGPVDGPRFEQWLADAERICTMHNSLLAIEDSFLKGSGESPVGLLP